MFITTALDFPGCEIMAGQGEIFGTGVWVSPVSDYAEQQYASMAASGQMPHQDAYQSRISEWDSASQ